MKRGAQTRTAVAENRALGLLETASGDHYDERVRKALEKAPEDLKLEISGSRTKPPFS
jgi:hypothetical protein